MTPAEFNLHYKKISNLYPLQFGNQDKANAIAREVSGLSVEWWERVVSKIIAANDPFMKLYPLIEAEKRRINQEHSTSEQARDFERMKRNATGMGLEAMKREHNAGSVWELVEKFKKGTA